MAEPITNLDLEYPYEVPTRYFEIGPNGPTGVILDRRRPSESYIPIPRTRRGRRNGNAIQESLDFDVTDERRQRNTLINDLRREVERWRARDYERATPSSRSSSNTGLIPHARTGSCFASEKRPRRRSSSPK